MLIPIVSILSETHEFVITKGFKEQQTRVYGEFFNTNFTFQIRMRVIEYLKTLYVGFTYFNTGYVC